MEEEKKGKNLTNYLDALVDKDGLRTEVTVSLSDATLIKTSLYLIGTVAAGTLTFYLIRNHFKH